VKKPIDVSKIRDMVQSEHTKFISNLGLHIQKANADHKLLEEITISKIKYVLNIFIESKVIDTIMESENGPLKTIKLIKSNTDNFIVITTNGLSTTVTGMNYFILSSNEEEELRFCNMWDENFDWYEFSTKLLDLIHSIIYERKYAFDIKIKSILEDCET